MNHKQIGIVDASNIDEYSMLDFRAAHPLTVIWTRGTGSGSATTYNSYQFHPLNLQEREEFDRLQDLLKKHSLCFKSIFPLDGPPFAYCKANLQTLRQSVDEYIQHIDGIGVISLAFSKIGCFLDKLNQMTDEELLVASQTKQLGLRCLKAIFGSSATEPRVAQAFYHHSSLGPKAYQEVLTNSPYFFAKELQQKVLNE